MHPTNQDSVFAGSIPDAYDEYLVPLIFESYATDLAVRVRSTAGGDLLEVAAGTGVLTRALAATLPAETVLVATDLNQAMLDRAEQCGTARPVEWRQADALQLPFPSASFDTIVCQFGVMFFPDRTAAFREARRVLRPQGRFLFNSWDRIEENDFAAVTTDALATLFPESPPRFLARVPHGYYDTDAIGDDLVRSGFRGIRIETVESRSQAETPWIPAVAYCQGTPLRNEIEALDASRLTEATALVREELARRFGEGPVDGKIQAHIVSAES